MAITINGAEGFSDLQIKAMSEYTVFAAHRNLAPLALFSHTFTELAGRPGESIAVPVYDLSAGGDFVAGSNDYGTGVNEVGGLTITLDKHYVKSVSITDPELAFTGINWARDTAAALGERVTRDVNAYVFDKLSGLELTATTATYFGDNPSKTTVAGLYALAETSDIPVDKCVVVLSPTYFSKVLGLVDYAMIGSGDYIKTGVIKGLFGFKGFVCSSNLPTGVNGAVILDEAMGIASKYNAPQTAGAYPQAWAATSDEGFSIGFRRFMNLSTGQNNFSVDALFGAKLLQPSKGVKLI